MDAPPDLLPNIPAISAYVNDWSNPMIMETIHTRNATLPATPAMPPMENSTNGGTPAATQNAPRQVSVRCNSPESVLADGTLAAESIVAIEVTLPRVTSTDFAHCSVA
jgi:hypothetical protein